MCPGPVALALVTTYYGLPGVVGAVVVPPPVSVLGAVPEPDESLSLPVLGVGLSVPVLGVGLLSLPVLGVALLSLPVLGVGLLSLPLEPVVESPLVPEPELMPLPVSVPPPQPTATTLTRASEIASAESFFIMRTTPLLMWRQSVSWTDLRASGGGEAGIAEPDSSLARR